MSKLKRVTVDASIERNIATGMIVNSTFIKEIQPILRLNLIKAPFIRHVISWCTAYFDEFNDAPKETIQFIYNSKKDSLDEDLDESIDTFLFSISEEYDREKFNSDFVLKEAEEYFQKRSLDELATGIKTDISNNNLVEAELKRTSYKEIIRPVSSAVKVYSAEAIANTFNNLGSEAIFQLPGALGQMTGPFCRGEFIVYTAPGKRGKTFTMLDVANRAVISGLKVIYFSLEMTLSRMNLRLYQNLCGTYAQSYNDMLNNVNDTRIVQIPYFDDDDDVALHSKKKEAVTQSKATKKAQAVMKMSKGGELRLICAPGLSNKDIRDRIYLERNLDGFIPDMIISDYIDIQGPEPKSPREFRHQINYTWQDAAASAEELNAIWLTATQGGRSAYKKDMEQHEVTEDIRKLNHVTRMIGINPGMDKSDTSLGLSEANAEIYKRYSFRMNMLVERHGHFDPEHMVRVIHQLEIGKPYLDSRWVNN